MDAKIKKQIKALNDMRLPDLQAKFREVVGEESRSPNRKFLIRKITEKLTAADATAAPAESAVAPAEGAAAPAEGAAAEGATAEGTDEGAAEESAAEESAAAEGAAEGAAEEGGGAAEGAAPEGAPARRARASAGKEKPLSQMTVPELAKLYAKVVGRPTGSTNKAYLIWKIREARKGRVTVGPRKERARGEPGDFKVLPFRLPTRTVERLDKAYERHGYKSRTDFLRAATRALLTHHGETEVAALFEPEDETESTEQRPARRTPRVRAATPSRKTRKARATRGRASGGRRSRARGR
jgi:Arc/MetJ-type ribon-helix-helix transcriptional regulator